MSAEGFPQLSDPPPWPRRRTTLYYHAHGVVITSRELSVSGERYEIAELIDIVQSRGARHPGTTVALIIAGVEAVIIAPLLGVVRAPAVWLLGGVALVIPCVIGLVYARRWPARYELIAWYRGQQHTLFATRDAHEFGKVSRALLRAVQAGDEH
jgi:hypothetical protein